MLKRNAYILVFLLLVGCNSALFHGINPSSTPSPAAPHEQRWGIYRLDLASQNVYLLYSSSSEISFLHLPKDGDRFVFSQKISADVHDQEEIFSVDVDGSHLQQLTRDPFRNLYPVWFPYNTQIAFLSQRSDTLGIFIMNADGSQIKELYDSEFQDTDIDWVGDRITFTRNIQIWTMQSDGSGAKALTKPPRGGEWGTANLPFGDYDPRICPDGTKVVFERLLDDRSPNGNYDLFSIDLQTGEETRLTGSEYSQGLASWSHSGRQLVYIIAAIGSKGVYDMYIMDVDGSVSQNITPDYFPPQSLCQ
jgi:Tol biopolymer transport system component